MLSCNFTKNPEKSENNAEDKVIYHQECKETTKFDVFMPPSQNSHSERLVSERADVIRNHPIKIIDRPYYEENAVNTGTINQGK